jgi:hypothetical protein
MGFFFGGFNSAHRHLINVTPHLFLGATELTQASLISSIAGQLSTLSNVSNSSYCSMAMHVGEIH